MVEGWKMVSLGDCSIGSLTYGANAPAKPYTFNEPKYLRITDITSDGRYSSNDIVSADLFNPERYLLHEGDIVVARTGASVGKSYLYSPVDGDVIYAGYLIKASIDHGVADEHYIFSCLNTIGYWQWVANNSARSGQPGISATQLKTLPIYLPPMEEQKAIAETLGDMDDLTASLEAFIKKKRALRQGALHDLLSGHRRLSGFTGAWRRVPLGEVTLMSTSTVYCKEINQREYIGTDNMLPEGGGIVPNELELSYVSVREYLPGDTLVSNIRPYLKKSWYANRSGGCSNDVIVFRSKDIGKLVPQYLNIALSSDAFFSYVSDNSAGTKMPRGDKAAIARYELDLPESIDEQIAIANVISDFDFSIAALEQELSKYRLVRQGMMEELLSGTIRLV